MRSGIAYRFFSYFFLRITIAVLLGLLTFPTRTQANFTRNSATEYGLPSNIVRSVSKDSTRILAGQQSVRYRLLPVKKTWSNFSSDRKAVFAPLSPGNYLLEIQSVNPLDQKHLSTLSYSFQIMPPFYLRWWFILCVLVILTAISIILLRLRFRQIRQQEHQKADVRNELNSIEMKALKAQMNPHFIFNAINAIQSFILSNNVDQALYYLSIFAKLVRKTLENATKDFIPLCEEMEYIHFYIELEKMRYEGQFSSEIDIDPQLPIETTLIPPMIIQPFVENAIKHGLLKLKDAGVLKIVIRKLSDSQYIVVIEDNGIGRQKSAELKQEDGRIHNSKGLELTNARIRLLNEMSRTGKYHIASIDLYHADGSSKGTRIEVTFPI